MQSTPPTPSSQVENQANRNLVDEHTQELREVRSLLEEHLRLHHGKPVDREWLSWEQAADVAGTTPNGARAQLKRERGRVDGVAVRRRRGFVHRRDWLRFLEARAERRPRGIGQVAREALDHLEAHI